MNKTLKYRRLGLLCITGILIFFWSCKSNKIAKSEAKANELAILDSLYTQNNYRIEIDVAYPFTSMATTQATNVLLLNTGNSANRIDVGGEGNFIEINNDSVRGYLPFFGERRLNAGNYGGNDLAIQFDGLLEGLNKEINTAKGKLKLEFTADQKGVDHEKYNIRIEIYPNKNSDINISPIFRTFINYKGRLVDVEEEEDK